tara:strand:+ start:223 stop:453 length:231 start_codon:yes stop_codon:yes gene_type:complete
VWQRQPETSQKGKKKGGKEGESKNKSSEQKLNLSGSWHKGHSQAYNTPFLFKSYAKDLSPPIFELVFSISSAVTML